jgi:hypothetical protein
LAYYGGILLDASSCRKKKGERQKLTLGRSPEQRPPPRALPRDFFNLPPKKAKWLARAQTWHGWARISATNRNDYPQSLHDNLRREDGEHHHYCRKGRRSVSRANQQGRRWKIPPLLMSRVAKDNAPARESEVSVMVLMQKP